MGRLQLSLPPHGRLGARTRSDLDRLPRGLAAPHGRAPPAGARPARETWDPGLRPRVWPPVCSRRRRRRVPELGRTHLRTPRTPRPPPTYPAKAEPFAALRDAIAAELGASYGSSERDPKCLPGGRGPRARSPRARCPRVRRLEHRGHRGDGFTEGPCAAVGLGVGSTASGRSSTSAPSRTS